MPIHLKSEASVYKYLKKFLAENPKSCQLDGSIKPKQNGNVIAIFTYSIDGRKYKLTGDLTRAAAEQFIALAEEHGDPGVVLKEHSHKGQDCLILATTNTPNGWNCPLYVEKARNNFDKS